VIAITEYARPKKVTFYAFAGGNTRFIVFLPDDITERPLEEQERLVREAACQIYARNRGHTMFRGAVLGYAYFPRYGEPPQRFTITGDRDPSTEPLNPPCEAWIRF